MLRRRAGTPPVSEDELFSVAVEGGYAINHPGEHDHGACSPQNLMRLLRDRYGIESDVQPQSVDRIADAVGKGRGVSITIHPYHWGSYVTDKWFHEVAVTGVEYGPDGQVAAFIINDTGLGTCGLRLSVDDYRKDAFRGAEMVVSKDRKW